jgi:hypothetical protein
MFIGLNDRPILIIHVSGRALSGFPHTAELHIDFHLDSTHNQAVAHASSHGSTCNKLLLPFPYPITRFPTCESMSPTTIHNPSVPLSRAGHDGTITDQAMIMPFNKPVLVVSGSFSQDDIDRYTCCFKSPHIGSWIRRDAVSTSVAFTGAITPADDRLDIPQVAPLH